MINGTLDPNRYRWREINGNPWPSLGGAPGRA